MRGLVAGNRRLSLAVLAVLLVVLAMPLSVVLGAGKGAVSDSTSCSGWSTASQAQQQTYARLYVKEHGALPSGARNAGSVVAAVNHGCLEAFSNDVADNENVVQAITGR